MNSYNLYQVDAFTNEKFTGNQAGVVLNADGLSEDNMQKIARELNLPNTVFVFSTEDNTHDVHLRFFTPIREESICGHATIAAHYVRAIKNKLETTRVYQKTGAGILPVDIIKEENDYRVIMTQGDINFGEIITDSLLDRVLASLNIGRHQILNEYPVQVVSTGNGKVIIPVNSVETLNKLNPDMELISELSIRFGVSGFYVFTITKTDALVHGRMFAPAYGVNEDPVTGNANSALGAYLVHNKIVEHNNTCFSFKAIQGEAMGRKGSVIVEVSITDNEPTKVRISGNAVIVYEAVISI